MNLAINSKILVTVYLLHLQFKSYYQATANTIYIATFKKNYVIIFIEITEISMHLGGFLGIIYSKVNFLNVHK